MNKLLISVLLLIFLGIPSFAQADGNLKIITPILDCEVYVDGITLEVDRSIATAEVTSGYHDVIVTRKDGWLIYDREVFVSGGVTTTIKVVSLPEAAKEEPKQEEQKQEEEKWGDGWGFGVGLDNTDYRIEDGNSYSLTPQFDLSVFYSGHLFWNAYFDFSASLFRTFGKFREGVTSTEVTVYPINFGLKFKTTEYTMIGVNMNMSIWAGTIPIDPGIDGEPGFRLYLDVRPISSELGYILKRGNNGTTKFTSQGFYYKYKFYF